MRTTRLTKIAMVIFLSMIFFLGVQRPVLAADRNTTVKIPVEQIFEVNNSADADKTGSYVLIADQIQNPMPEGSNRRTFTWNMSGNSSTELIMNVGQAGEYHYNLYDIFYGRYKDQEEELLKRYIDLAPREDFSDILDAIDHFIYFESRKRERDTK